MTCNDETRRLVFSSKQGDDIVRSWTRATVGRVFDDSDLLVQWRNTQTGALLATSEDDPAEGVLSIDLSTCDFSDPDAYVFGFKITGTDSVDVTPLTVIEAQCTIDDALTTFFSEPWEITKQWAVSTP